MNHLDHQDLLTVTSALSALHSDLDPLTLSERTLTAASKVISADSVAFTGFRTDGQYADLVWHNAGDASPEEMEVFANYVHENPLVGAFFEDHRTEVLKITDLIAPKQFERTTIYNEFYRRVGVSNQLVTPLRITDDLLITCSINIGNSDFSERDRLILTLFAPHLSHAIRNAFAYQRLSGALETEACGIIVFNSHGKAVYISEFARQLFLKYYSHEKQTTDGLPESLGDWIKKTSLPVSSEKFAAPTAPLRLTGQNSELTVRLTVNKQTGEQTLMLEEKHFASPQKFEQLGLTKREAEILFWITQGKSDEVIAFLCGISRRTVHKHIEHIYEKLGVETRTGAMLRALDFLR